MNLKSKVEKKDGRVIQTFTFIIRPSASGTGGKQEGASRGPVTRGGGGLPVEEEVIQSTPASFKGSRIAGRHGG